MHKRYWWESQKGSLVRPRLDLRVIGCGGMDWIDLAQDRDQ
jgi:hypothetical protein